MKRLLAIITLLCVLFSFAGCKKGSELQDNSFHSGNNTTSENEQQPKNAEVGDIIKFGHWEQDGNLDNGDEEIEWIVLEVSNGKYLALSKYALASEVYAYEDYTTFEESQVSSFLEDVFYDDAFSYLEEKKLLNGTITSDDGNFTPKEKVFILSASEIRKYAAHIENIYDCYPTKNIQERLAIIDGGEDDGKCYWWVRDNSFFGTVMAPNSVAWVGTKLVDEERGIRPAIWLDFDFANQSDGNAEISDDFLGKWYAYEGADNHTIIISNDGTITFEDGSDEKVNYICYSSTEIAIKSDDGEYVFVLEDDKITRYEEGNSDDIYIYKKQ